MHTFYKFYKFYKLESIPAKPNHEFFAETWLQQGKFLISLFFLQGPIDQPFVKQQTKLMNKQLKRKQPVPHTFIIM